jgi:hypothetical protein
MLVVLRVKEIPSCSREGIFYVSDHYEHFINHFATGLSDKVLKIKNSDSGQTHYKDNQQFQSFLIELFSSQCLPAPLLRDSVFTYPALAGLR